MYVPSVWRSIHNDWRIITFLGYEKLRKVKRDNLNFDAYIPVAQCFNHNTTRTEHNRMSFRFVSTGLQLVNSSLHNYQQRDFSAAKCWLQTLELEVKNVGDTVFQKRYSSTAIFSAQRGGRYFIPGRKSQKIQWARFHTLVYWNAN